MRSPLNTPMGFPVYASRPPYNTRLIYVMSRARIASQKMRTNQGRYMVGKFCTSLASIPAVQLNEFAVVLNCPLGNAQE